MILKWQFFMSNKHQKGHDKGHEKRKRSHHHRHRDRDRRHDDRHHSRRDRSPRDKHGDSFRHYRDINDEKGKRDSYERRHDRKRDHRDDYRREHYDRDHKRDRHGDRRRDERHHDDRHHDDKYKYRGDRDRRRNDYDTSKNNRDHKPSHTPHSKSSHTPHSKSSPTRVADLMQHSNPKNDYKSLQEKNHSDFPVHEQKPVSRFTNTPNLEAKVEKQETTHPVPRESRTIGEVEMSGSSHSSMSVLSAKPVEAPKTNSRQKFGIDKNLFSVYSYLYDEGKKKKHKPSTQIFKSGQEVSKNDKDIVSEVTELTELYNTENKKRDLKLQEKLVELQKQNMNVSKINFKKLIESIAETTQKVKVDELSTVPVLYVKPISHNTVINNLKETAKNNLERERKLKEKLLYLDTKLESLRTDIHVCEFKSKVCQVKIDAHDAAIKSLEE